MTDKISSEPLIHDGKAISPEGKLLVELFGLPVGSVANLDQGEGVGGDPANDIPGEPLTRVILYACLGYDQDGAVPGTENWRK